MQRAAAIIPSHTVEKGAFFASLTAQGCMILLDPALRPPKKDPSWPTGELVAVDMDHPRIDPSVFPQLLILRRNDELLSQILTYTLEEAEVECSRDSLSHGRGRRICAWMISSASASEVSEHLRRAMFQSHGITGMPVWLRLHDPAVLWLLWPELSPQQQRSLMGPLDRVYLLDPTGKIEEFHRPGSPLLPQKLELSPQQWATVDATSAACQALRDWTSMSMDIPIRIHAQNALDAAKRAAGMGFTDVNDQAQFALLALTIHPNFDCHAMVRKRIEMRSSEDYFSGLVAEIEASQWDRIATDLRMGLAPISDDTRSTSAYGSSPTSTIERL